MRQLRRLLSVLVMAVTIVGMSMTAFAQESVSGAGGNGSITIENASKGIVYSIYKVFDAKVNAEGTSVAYSTKNFVDNPYFEKDSVGNISAKKEAYKTDSNEQLSEGAIEWIKENGTKICSETSDGSIKNHRSSIRLLLCHQHFKRWRYDHGNECCKRRADRGQKQ